MIFFHRKTRLRVGLLAWLLVINFLSAGTYSLLTYKRQKVALIGGIDAQLRTAALAVPEFLPPGYHDRILRGEVPMEEYMKIARRLTDFANAANVFYVYSFVETPDGTLLTASTSGSAKDWAEIDFPAPGKPYEASPIMLDVLCTGLAAAGESIDEFGHWRSYLVPFKSEGEAKVVLGADIELALVKAKLHAALAESLLVGLAGFVLASALVFWITALVTRDLRRVVEDSEKIARFELDLQTLPGSRIVEIDQLDRAIDDMKAGLLSFRKYVPADLVRELLESGEAARLGSRSAHLTLFFSDLENFTTMAESQPPESVASQLGEYLGAMSDAIHAHRGTVDKFIGDAVMAFWGAPKENASQIPDACAAALACIREVTLLNDRRRAAGAPALNARFGIHTGPVVVGNLGSKERLNYTAIGDTVNLASRLEGLNQYYGTTVLVSSEVVAGLDETWVFRPVDRVAVKGRKAGVTVYELLGGPGYPVQSSLPGLAAALWAAYEARDWSTACEVAERLLAEIPGDLACRVLHERCMHFLEFPPPPDWDGVWKVTEK